jgi:hypothetical protein
MEPTSKRLFLTGYQEPHIKDKILKKKVYDILPHWGEEKLEYWLEWFGLAKHKDR